MVLIMILIFTHFQFLPFMYLKQRCITFKSLCAGNESFNQSLHYSSSFCCMMWHGFYSSGALPALYHYHITIEWTRSARAMPMQPSYVAFLF